MVLTWTEMTPGNNPRLVVLTDDGRVPEALLDPARKAPKLYEAGRRRGPGAPRAVGHLNLSISDVSHWDNSSGFAVSGTNGLRVMSRQQASG